MKLLFLALTILLSGNLLAQNRSEDFEIDLPEQKVSKSLYSTIRFVDTRENKNDMGIVQLGAFNKKARVIPKTSLATQLNNLIKSLTDSTAKNGDLLFQLRQFSFAEITGATSERGYCYLRAQLYSRVSEAYQKLNSIDTVIYIKSMDVTRALFRKGSKTLSDFIAANLIQTPIEKDLFSPHDVMSLDSIEKRKIPVYNTTVYKDGLYANYESFKLQMPEQQITGIIKNGVPSGVKSVEANGRTEKVKSKDIYAVVLNGQPFIATDYGYYPLEKREDDFYFTGKAKVTANTGNVIAASLFFGIIGGLIASDAEATFNMKIDHLNGGFVRLKEVRITQN